MLYVNKSQATGKSHAMELPITEEEFMESYLNWQQGMFIQDAFPLLNADQCEFIKTGITPAEWDEIFADTEDQ